MQILFQIFKKYPSLQNYLLENKGIVDYYFADQAKAVSRLTDVFLLVNG
jgi:hypothetical protein